MTVERLIEGWSEQTRTAVAGRHVLAIQDTSEIHFSTRPKHRRGLGEVGKGNARGVLAHVMAAVDADNGSCLGLVTGSIYNRKGRVRVSHAKRALKDKESKRWTETPQAAKPVLAAASMVTAMSDRECDIYHYWANAPGPNFHLLTRMMHDRALAGGGTVGKTTAAWPFAATREVGLSATPGRAARKATLSLRFGEVTILRPDGKDMKHLPKTVTLRLVEAVERDPPAGVEPIHWRLLTTHAVDDVAMAWQIVDWYRLRWIIEQLFRLMKSDGLRLEDSQLETADALMKLAAIAARAACVILQLVQARRAGQHRLLQTGDRRSRPIERRNRRQDRAPKESARPAQPGMGQLDHRPHGRLERLPLLAAARPDHHAQRLGIFLRHRQGLDAPRRAATLAGIAPMNPRRSYPNRIGRDVSIL